MIYLMCQKWRSVINIASMRYFGDYDALADHIGTKKPAEWWGAEPWHVYRVYDDGRDADPLTLNENRALGLRPRARPRSKT